MLAAWGLSTASDSPLKSLLIVLGVMIAQRLLEEFEVMDLPLSAYSLRLCSFSACRDRRASLWIVINVVGYAYGAGIVEEQVKAGNMKPQEADLFNHHAGVCHSLIEDTLLFARRRGSPSSGSPSLGSSRFSRRLDRAGRGARSFSRSFRVGTV